MTARTPLPESLTSDRTFTVRAALAAGVRPGRLRASDLIAPTWGVRTDSDADETLQQKAVLRSLRAEAFLCGRSAATHHGFPLPPRLRGTIEVGVPDPARAPRRRGVIGRALRLSDGDVVEKHGLRLTIPVRTFCDLARDLSVPELVAITDILPIPQAELTAAVEAVRDPRTRPKLIAAVELRDIASESPKESELRALVRLAGLPAPRCQAVVLDAQGGFVARVDLAFDGHGEVLEYQGDHHRTDMHQWRRDRTREATLESLGLHVTEVTELDLRHPNDLVERIAANLRRRGWTGSLQHSRWFPA